MFQFTEAISIEVNGVNQQEGNYYLEKLLANGCQTGRGGWLKDKFGVSWQVVPMALPTLLAARGIEKRKRTLAAMMKMSRFEIAQLEDA